MKPAGKAKAENKDIPNKEVDPSPIPVPEGNLTPTTSAPTVNLGQPIDLSSFLTQFENLMDQKFSVFRASLEKFPKDPEDFADPAVDLADYIAKNGPAPSNSAFDTKGSANATMDTRGSKNPTRRLTMTEREINSAEDAKVDVQITRPQPRFDHIKLESLHMEKIIRFIDETVEYQSAYSIKLPVGTLLSPKVRDQLLAHNKELTDKKFYELSFKKLLTYLYAEVQPKSKLSFRRMLQKYARFEAPPGFNPYNSSFKPFYTALLLYRRTFTRTYEILAVDNLTNVPKADNKPGGLIKVFIDAIPFGYGHSVFELLKDQEASFSDIYSFMIAFYTEVESDLTRNEGHRAFLTHFSGSAAAQAGKTSGRKISELANISVVEPSVAPTFRETSDEYSESETQFLSDDLGLDLDRDAHEMLPMVDPIDSDEDSGSDLEYDRTAHEIKPLAAMGKPSVFPQRSTGGHQERPRGCLTKLLRGDCKNPQCKYSHRSEDVEAARISLVAKLSEDRKKPNVASGPRSILKRDTLGVVVHEAEEDVGLREFGHAAFMEILYISENPAASIFSAVHHSGKIILHDNVTLAVDDVLFDSGALQGNYVSESFIAPHRTALQRSRVNSKNKVKLADNRTIVELQEAYNLTVKFVDQLGTEHVGTTLFWVLPTCSHPMIIGLPAIIMRFSKLHKFMIDMVVDKLSDKTEQQLDTLDLEDPAPKYPWTIELEDEAPEDSSTELPSSFSEALHFMEMTVEEAEKEFFALFEKHIQPDFAKQTDVVNLLRTVGLRVFVPSNWEGVKGVPPISLQWKDTLPESMKPRARPINPRLFQHAQKEFDRLRSYFYEPSESPWASCLVIAPKATEPFIRFCGDYVQINKHIMTGHYPIPNVQHSLAKIIKYKVFIDLDLANSFHQFRLDSLTSARLSIQTPWGQYQPRFMPEGIGPASGYLQAAMVEFFKDFADWTIVIFDNLLVLANDYADAYNKLEKILERCIHHNLTLKFKKSWLGFSHANFFGYLCREGTFELAQDRIASVQEIPFPTTTKLMQSFLGTILFFKPFIPHYSSLTARLNDMVHKDFSWNRDAWKVDYEGEFAAVKQVLLHPNVLHYPDYELEWLLRTDASTYGVGGVLLQKRGETLEPIAFVSQKFSKQAQKWATIEQEAYAMYYCVRSLAYYLTGKQFILETDHHNLLWMEASSVPKIVRWRILLQSFNFLVRHIAGKTNLVADFLSRMHTPTIDPKDTLDVLTSGWESSIFGNVTSAESSVEDVLREVHGGRMPHGGARKTWQKLNEQRPGHRIPFRVIQEFVASCPICQKDRLSMADTIAPLVRHLKPLHNRSMIGLDTLTITPPDHNGNQYLLVITNHFTKFTALYPLQNRDALSIARSIFQYVTSYGLVDSIITDPGSEFDNKVLEHLTAWLGLNHRFSLVGRHQSNGVEGTNKQILRHLRALVWEERLVKRWSDPEVLCLVQYFINSVDSSETGVIPYAAHFGSADATYCRLPVDGGDRPPPTQEYVQLLDENLHILREKSKKFQDDLISTRTASTPEGKQNLFQEGDLVLFDSLAAAEDSRKSKLSPRYIGPYEVCKQTRNDVEAKHVTRGNIEKFHVEKLKLFTGTLEEAKRVAQLDGNQYLVRRIITYSGDPGVRSSVDFQTEFEDGSILWLPFSQDLFDTREYVRFCQSRPELAQMASILKVSNQLRREILTRAISRVKPNDRVYVNLRWFGHTWYQRLNIPEKFHTDYWIEGKYGRFLDKQKKRITIYYPVFEETHHVDNLFVEEYGANLTLPEATESIASVLVDKEFLMNFPQIKAPLLGIPSNEPSKTASIDAGVTHQQPVPQKKRSRGKKRN